MKASGRVKLNPIHDVNFASLIKDWTNGQFDMDMLMNPWAILTAA